MSDDTMTPIQAFGALLTALSGGLVAIGKQLAIVIGVPYLEERQGGSKLLGYRRTKEVSSGWRRGPLSHPEEFYDGPLMPTHEFRTPDGELIQTTDWSLVKAGYVQLTEEIWESDEFWPDSFNTVDGAMEKLKGGVNGIYAHGPSMNLVFVKPDGGTVGIKSTAMSRSREKTAQLAGLKGVAQ